jgi:MFS transporter, ACS family, hexuronate transporter
MSSSCTPSWKWFVCLLLLFATVLLYMDRQTLALTATRMKQEFHLDDVQYGRLEAGFSWAFAVGALFFGFLADRVSVRWLYPFVLVSWSIAGLATAYAGQIGSLLVGWTGWTWVAESPTNRGIYAGLLLCRTLLGLFESGQWPCALITTQRILSREDRSFGNGILQSGASIGAIFTPFVVQLTMTDAPGSWRIPFLIVGGLGLLWIFPWFSLVTDRDLTKHANTISESDEPEIDSPSTLRRYLVLMLVVVAINMTWQFFRAWLPKFLKEAHGYGEAFGNYFTSAYYIATDIGCITVGFLVKQLANRGWNVHRARLVTFLGCSLLTALGTVAALVSRGPLLLGLLLLIGAGALGLFPNYYAFGQEISKKHQGLVVGSLATFAWLATGLMQNFVGQTIQATGSYTGSMALMGIAPFLAFLVLWLLWDRQLWGK